MHEYEHNLTLEYAHSLINCLEFNMHTMSRETFIKVSKYLSSTSTSVGMRRLQCWGLVTMNWPDSIYQVDRDAVNLPADCKLVRGGASVVTSRHPEDTIKISCGSNAVFRPGLGSLPSLSLISRSCFYKSTVQIKPWCQTSVSQNIFKKPYV